MPKQLRVILYPVFGFFCLFLFFLLLFPFDGVKLRLAREMEVRLGDMYSISIGSLSASLPSGLTLKEVEVRSRAYPDIPPFKFSKANLQFGLFSFLGGTTDVDIDLRYGKGKMTGSVAWKKTGVGVDLKLDKMDLSAVNLFTQKRGITLSGSINGLVQAELSPQDPLKNTGKIYLEIPEFRAAEITTDQLTAPALNLALLSNEKSKVDIQIDRGNYEIKDVTLVGGDPSVQTNGKVYGARQISNFRFNIKGSFRLSDELADKIIFSDPTWGKNSFLYLLGKEKGADGAYPLSITGRLSKPTVRIGNFKLPI